MDADSGERLLLAELVTFHRLHPDEREVMTEGRTDACVVRWFLDSFGIDTPVYTVSSRIHIDDDFVLSLGLPIGERSRLIAAARYLEGQAGFDAESVSLVIDADYAHTVDRPVPAAPSLLVTDYACIESYCLNRNTLSKYFSFALHAAELNAEEVIHGISDILRDFFAIRRLLHSLPEHPTMVGKISNKIKLVGGILLLDVDALLRDSVARSPIDGVKKLTKEELGASFDEIRSELNLDVRYCINGHDLAMCLNSYLVLAYGKFFTNERKGFGDATVAGRAWMGCLEVAYLLTTGLFSELRKRADAPTRA